jgi:hypothetical protein
VGTEREHDPCFNERKNRRKPVERGELGKGNYRLEAVAAEKGPMIPAGSVPITADGPDDRADQKTLPWPVFCECFCKLVDCEGLERESVAAIARKPRPRSRRQAYEGIGWIPGTWYGFARPLSICW